MEYIVFLLLAPISAAILLLAITAVWPYRQKMLSKALLAYLVAVALLLVSNVLELLSVSATATLFWAEVGHIFYALLPVAWLFFALAFTGFERFLVSPRRFLFLVLPLATVALVFTNPLHHLFWSQISFTRAHAFTTVETQYGPWFWIYGVYNYALLVIGAAAILSERTGYRGLYRKQSILVTLGALLPLAVNLIYVFRVFPSVSKDFTPIAFAVAGIVFYIGVHRFGLLRITPVAAHLVLEDVESGVFVLDLDGNILECNHAAEGILQIDRNSAVGTPWLSHHMIETLLEGVSRTERTVFETSLQEGEKVRFFDISVRPVKNATGRHAGTVFTVTDTSERVRLLESQKKMLAALEERNRNVDELQLQLLHQEKLAAIGEIAAGVAHEINNPLTFLKSSVTLLQEEIEHLLSLLPEEQIQSETERVKRELESVSVHIEDGFKRVANVLHSLLRFSRPEYGQAAGKSDLNEIVRTTLHVAQPALRERIAVETSFGPLPPVTCHAGEISQAILNIILNAIHALEDQKQKEHGFSGVIRITTTAGTGAVICEISDNGSGIPDAIRERVFEPFFSTKPEGQGTGLGLSIARNIVEGRHGGRLSVKPGKESCFVMELPVSHERA